MDIPFLIDVEQFLNTENALLLFGPSQKVTKNFCIQVSEHQLLNDI